MPPHPKTGLSLSGGGYRATAFHLGTLRKFHSLGILSDINVISTISGGSITGAYYCLNQHDFRHFEESLYHTLQHNNIIKGVLLSRTSLQLILVLCIPWLSYIPPSTSTGCT